MQSIGPWRGPGGERAATPRGAQHLVTVSEPRGRAAEAYRALWTNLAVSTLDPPLKTVLFTSPDADDGKSTALANLGVVAAAAGRRVLLVDCDLRQPTLHTIFDLPDSTGLMTTILDESATLPEQPTAIEGLRVLTAGPLPSNPAEVLSSQRMERTLELLRKAADLILLDAPPAGLVADALGLAPRVDGVLLVLNATRTRRERARHTRQQLERVGARILGVVLSNAQVDRAAYRY